LSNKVLLSLSLYFPLSFYHFLYLTSLLLYQRHDIDLFFVTQGPLLHGSQGYDVKLSLTLLLLFYFLTHVL
jgi:hypothetical protein